MDKNKEFGILLVPHKVINLDKGGCDMKKEIGLWIHTIIQKMM